MPSAFEKMTRAVTVEDIATPIGPRLSPEMNLLDVDVKPDAFCPVETEFGYTDREGGGSLYRGTGWVSGRYLGDYADRIEDEGTGEYTKRLVAHLQVQPLRAQSLVSGDMSALDATQLSFEPGNPYFVVARNGRANIIGTLMFPNFGAMPFRMCLLALTLELEEAAFDLLALPETLEKSWDAIDKKGKAFAMRALENRGIDIEQWLKGEKASPELSEFLKAVRLHRYLGATTLGAKRTALEIVFPDLGSATIELIRRVEYLRNACAHPADTPVGEHGKLKSAEELRAFVADVQALMQRLRGIIAADDVDPGNA